MENRSTDRNNNFNLLRLIFSVMVVYSHSFGLLAQTKPVLLNRTMGNLAVLCFFVISGYLITQSYLHTSHGLNFFYKRALRLLPALFISYILGNIMASLCGNFDNPVPHIINGVVWTLPWEVSAYIGCALIGFLGLLDPKALGCLWVTSWAAIMINSANTSLTFEAIVPMLFMFLSGSFLAVNEDKLRLPNIGPVCFLLLLIIQFKPNAIACKLFPDLNFASSFFTLYRKIF